MSAKIRAFRAEDRQTVLDISLAAFTPIHESFERLLGTEIFRLVYPDWRASNQEYVRSLCESEPERILVVEEDGRVVGFLHYILRMEQKFGEIGINAVHPDYQRRGIGAMLYAYVLDIMRTQGIACVEVSTGGDASHAPARRAYEKAGFVPLPLVRYYTKL